MLSLVPVLKSSRRAACERERSDVTEILANVLCTNSQFPMKNIVKRTPRLDYEFRRPAREGNVCWYLWADNFQGGFHCFSRARCLADVKNLIEK